MSNTLYLILGSVMVLGILLGIILMSKVKSARAGNMIGGICLLAIIVLTIIHSRLIADWRAWASLAVGSLIGAFAASRVKMIQMPQTVALLNGLGGAASALVAIVTLMDADISAFTLYTSQLALAVGGITLSGSLVAAGKLAKILPQKPVVLKGHSGITALLLISTLASMVFSGHIWLITAILSLLFGVVFALRVGGADMPITISLLNSLSGVAGGIAGIALGDPVLIAVGGIVGASGLLLTQIMCRAMNRKLLYILLGKTAAVAPKKAAEAVVPAEEAPVPAEEVAATEEKAAGPENLLKNARDVIIVPGYGMALSQAQQHVRQLADAFEQQGAHVRYAIHPVAGRMPGHMNVLLCEADVPYEQLFEMDDINADFASCDLAIAIGANDTINPAANTAEGTPIYGMPVLDIGDAKNIFVLNFDDKPGYAGVPNSLYTREDVVFMMGDAKESIAKLLDMMRNVPAAAETVPVQEEAAATPAKLLAEAKDVIIVPGYGMALSQAQQHVRRLADAFEQRGAKVRYAIHPVAGRMPGHMNVLLCEADVPYEQLFEMDDINADFASCDLAIAIGANDTINPAANTAEGTPIYGMPVLDIGDAKNIFVLNFDDKPGYAGVPNPLYTREDVVFMMGDAKESIAKLLDMLSSASAEAAEAPAAEEKGPDAAEIMNAAKDVIIVPGYGMALSQAQQHVRRLADALEQRGAKVRYAIHPVAGRMPGHMNVLLCEADVPYEQLFEMDDINADFASCDLAIAIGANDTINPAANTAEGTPIYGMPVLDIVDAKNIFVLNFDDKPGYAGVPNPLYTREDVVFMMGDAKESISKLLDMLS